MEDIFLIGSGQHARVVLYNIREQGKYRVIGLLDNNLDKVGTNIDNVLVVADYSVSSLKKLEKLYHVKKFFIGFGDMNHRKEVYEFFLNSGWKPVNIIHPNAVVSPLAKLGEGVLVEAGCLITPNPIIGNNVVINTGSQVNHDNVIGNHVYIASGVVLSGGVSIGENTLIDDGVVVCLGKSIGYNCIIGAGSIVTKNIENGVVAYGNPCRIVRKNG